MNRFKEVHFRIPKAVWTQWVQSMPAHGQRTAFLQRAIGVAIRLKPERDGMDNLHDKYIEEVVKNGQIDFSNRPSSERNDFPSAAAFLARRKKEISRDIGKNKEVQEDIEDLTA